MRPNPALHPREARSRRRDILNIRQTNKQHEQQTSNKREKRGERERASWGCRDFRPRAASATRKKSNSRYQAWDSDAVRGADANANNIKKHTDSCLPAGVNGPKLAEVRANAQDGSLQRRPGLNGQMKGKRGEKGHAGSGRDRRTGWCARSSWAVGRDWGAGLQVHGRQDQTK